ncbi:putative DNA helicase [Helianthus annuus]|nr:putative DNA helicase [Helianthus annuus]
MLATSLNLPKMSEIQVDELYLKGTLDLGSLASMMSTDKKFGLRNRVGLGEPKPQYESLQARLKAQSINNSPQKFSLKVSDIAFESYSVPERAADGIRRSFMSDSGTLQVHYVKVLEKGDTYEVKMKVSRSLKLTRGTSIRTRKLARDMLVFWKRIDKEMAEIRKKE